VFEIADTGKTGNKRTELLDGAGVQGAAVEHGPMVLFNTTGTAIANAEVSLPDMACDSLILTGLQPDTLYELNLGGLNATSVPAPVLPGVSAGTHRLRANSKGILRLENHDLKNLRLRIARQ
jgi:hypothetical protein